MLLYFYTSTNFYVQKHPQTYHKCRKIEEEGKRANVYKRIHSVCYFFACSERIATNGKHIRQRLMKQGLQAEQQILMGRKFIRHIML